MESRDIKIGALLVAALIVGVVFVPAVSAVSGKTKSVTFGTKATFDVGDVEITLDNYPDFSGATVTVKHGDLSDRYTVKVEASSKVYVAKIYDLDGNLIQTKKYSVNPLVSLDGGQPPIINGFILDAFIDIWPDKYEYNQHEEGTVNVHVDNYAIPDGFTDYFLKIPGGVEYINVYDGAEPDNVYNLQTSNDCVIIPKYWGLVCGPATVLYWKALHTFGYEKYIKVKVKYNDTGSFTHYAYDHVTEGLTGLGAWDEDSFDVTVS